MPTLSSLLDASTDMMPGTSSTRKTEKDKLVTSHPTFREFPMTPPAKQNRASRVSRKTDKDKLISVQPTIREFPMTPPAKDKHAPRVDKKTDKDKLISSQPTIREFPMTPPAKDNHAPGIDKKTDKDKLISSQPTIREFPMTPPVKDNHGSRVDRKRSSPEDDLSTTSLAGPGTCKRLARVGSSFPTLSPISTPSHARYSGKGKGKENDIAFSERAEDRDAAAIRPRSFPLSSQPLSSPSQTRGSRSAKRASDDSDDGQEHLAKRRKEDALGASACLDTFGIGYNEDSLELDPVADPSRLCPYCDELLPLHSTPLLSSLLAAARRKSYPDPRPRNPRGLKAPLPAYISACQRHRFETHHLPTALEKGWPTEIEFQLVPKRIEGMKKTLEAIILNCDGGEDGDDDDLYERPNAGTGPRERSIFWQEVQKEVRKQGSRAALGVKGQFANFEKAQPGYYGELGSVIIHQALYSLFPPSSFDASLITPLTPAEFIQRILVPEAALELIMQDLRIDRDDAMITLRDSAQYGVAMFPDAGTSDSKTGAVEDDDEHIGVADQIVMERARVRRIELEEEERIEEKMIREEELRRKTQKQEEKKAQSRNQRKERARKRYERAQASETERSETSACERSTSRQHHLASRHETNTEPDSDAMSIASTRSKRSTAVRKRKTKKPNVNVASSTSDMDIAISSDVDIDLEIVSDLDDRGHTSGGISGTAEIDIGFPSETEIVEILSQSDPDAGPSAAAIDSDSDPEMRLLYPPRHSRSDGHLDPQATPRPRPFPLDISTSSRHPTSTDSKGQEASTSRHPLLAAKSRRKATAIVKTDGWMSNMREHVSDDSDSPSETRRSSRQSKKSEHSWLLSQSSSGSSIQ
ncbi:RTC4-like domain-containing protein [Hygrophoropsis aurantiaca]|uniref:RTC4-like domain-containing protein n=1 Tax=Hygrophoropsis aurantiaca TaxID=72124 RepID=A0ACB8A6G7_9AGAM|nr:RTC4-like domain-containing protein [Hygrophoropsis aurantiaca]